MRFLILSSIFLLLSRGEGPDLATLLGDFFRGPCDGRERRDSIGMAEGDTVTYLRLFDTTAPGYEWSATSKKRSVNPKNILK